MQEVALVWEGAPAWQHWQMYMRLRDYEIEPCEWKGGNTGC